MTKAELIEKMAKDAGIAKSVAGKSLESFIEGVTKSLKKGNKVSLVGFGTFAVSKRKARKGRNPRTGETITIKAAKVPKFTAGKAFKEAIK
jgi:DNA-binding protein HU-beta